MDKKPNYNYRHNDEIHIYWSMDREPEVGRVVQYGPHGLKLALGDTGRAYQFDYDKSGTSDRTDVFRDASGRKVYIRNLNKDRRLNDNHRLKDIRL